MKRTAGTVAAFAAAALIGITTAQAADHNASDYTWAASAFVEGGFGWLDSDAAIGLDYDITNILIGGDFLINLGNNWNLQLGGAWHNADYDFSVIPINVNFTEFQANAIAFHRDPGMGLFGLEVGIYGQRSNLLLGQDPQYLRLGGVADFYVSDMMTVGAYGGALVPISTSSIVDTGFYAGGHATWYASSNFALSAFAKYTGTGLSSGPFEYELDSLRVGGKVRYQTAMSGVQLYASGNYFSCDGTDFGPLALGGDGAEVSAGISIALGGAQGGDLVTVDRNSTVDTRTWGCLVPFGFNPPVFN